MENIIPIVRVIIVNDNDEILLLKRKDVKYDNDKWTLPGGKIDFNEHAEETARREVKEETNLDVKDPVFAFYRENLPKEQNIDLHYIVLYFIVEEYSGNVTINEESSEFKWVCIDDIDTVDFAFAQKEALDYFFNIGS